MKIIRPSVEFFGEVPTDYENALKFIEVCGRTCYKSEDKITETSAEGFVRKLIKAGHLAMVEHSNFVVCLADTSNATMSKAIIDAGKYLSVRRDNTYLYVGGSLTAWYQRFSRLDTPLDAEMFSPFINTFGDLFEIGEDIDPVNWEVCPHNEIPKELHRYSAKFICDRGVSHELVRHRPCSFAQESTRYVNYGGKDMEFIEPEGCECWTGNQRYELELLNIRAEQTYKSLLNSGLSPQQARAVLPNALKTEIVVTADAAEWRHIRKLRTAKSSHPDMVRIMNMTPWETFL